MKIKEFAKKGYTVQVTYTNTQYMQADVNLNSIDLSNYETRYDTDLEFNNEDVIETMYDDFSSTYSVTNPQNEVIANDLEYSQLLNFIDQLKNSK